MTGNRRKVSLACFFTNRDLPASEHQTSLFSLLLVEVPRLSWVAETADILGKVNRNIAYNGDIDFCP